MSFKPYKNQVYETIKNQHNLRNLFEDREFPATSHSLFRYKAPTGINPDYIEWRRPHNICSLPQFSVGGFDPKDLHQGRVGNCWYIAGAVDIATKPKYLDIVVPKDQSFDYGYSGAFHFRFWQFGEWVDVVVDDKLPIYNGSLIYCSNRKCENEFWGPLLEKAYAKLAGCYEFLDGGFTQDAIVDMTGGVTEYLDVQHEIKTQSKQALWKSLYEAYKMGSLSGANINPKNMEREGKLANGLIVGHAYSITKVIEISPNKNNSYYPEIQKTLSTINMSAAPIRSNKPQSKKFKEQPIRNNVNYDVYDYSGYDNDENRFKYDSYSGGDGGYDYDYGGKEIDYNDIYGGDNDDNYKYDSYNGGGDSYDYDYGGKKFDINDDGGNSGFDYYDSGNKDLWGGGSNLWDNSNNKKKEKKQSSNSSICLIRLRNPWGDHHEWSGAWSDNSLEWRSIDENLKQKIGLVNEEDGEFWMNWDDFCSNFDILCSVHVSLNAFSDEIAGGFSSGNTNKWETKQYHGEWIPNKNAGGSGNGDYSSFWTNPQYLINISKGSTLDQSSGFNYATRNNMYITRDESIYLEDPDSPDKSTLVVSLFSKDTNREENKGEIVSFPKQFRIYRLKSDSYANHKQTSIKFSSNDLERVGSSHMYSIFREVSMRFRLDPGSYVIIPSTYDSNVAGKFLLRLSTETSIKVSDVSVLDINDKNSIHVPDNNFNEIEDKLYDYIGKELLSLNMSSEDESEEDESNYNDGSKSRKSLYKRYSNLASNLTNTYNSFSKAKKSFEKYTRPDNECNLS